MGASWSRGHHFVRRNRSVAAVAVIASLLASGTAAATSYLVLGASNTSSKGTLLSSSVNGSVLRITNNNSTGGTSARGLSIAVPAGQAPIVVNSSAGKATNLNADKLDGRDSSEFGRVRSFAASTNTTSDYTPIISLDGLEVTRRSFLFQGELVCAINASTAIAGHIDTFVIGTAGSGPVTATSTPVTNVQGGLARPSAPQTLGTLIFVNSATGKVITAVYSIFALPGNGGCMWQGTITAAA